MNTVGLALSDAKDATPRGAALRRVSLFLLPITACIGPLATISGPIFVSRALWIALILMGLVCMGRSYWSRSQTSLTFMAVVWIISGVVGITLWGFPPGGLRELGGVALGLCLLLALHPLHRATPRVSSAVANGWHLSFWATATIAIYEIRSGQHLGNYLTTNAIEVVSRVSDQPASTFGNPNAYGAFLLLCTPWLVYLFPTVSRVHRIPIAAALLMTPFLIWSADARICLAGFTLQVLVLIARERGSTPVLMLGLVAIVFAAFSSGVLDQAGGTSEVRLALSLNALWLAWDSALIGFGPGSFESVLAEGGLPFPTHGQVNAHNVWFEVLAQYGVAVFIAIAVWLLVAYRTPTCRRARPSVRAFIVGLAVAGIADSSILNASYFWVGLATLIVFIEDHESAEQAPSGYSAIGKRVRTASSRVDMASPTDLGALDPARRYGR